jgi:hypothetical protein
MQPPPSSPPQWSPDGQWWWDGTRWRPRNEPVPPPVPAYPVPPPMQVQPYGYPPGYAMPGPAPMFQMPPPVLVQPSPGLRIVLIVSLSLAVLVTGFLLFVAIFGTVTDSSSGISSHPGPSGDILFMVIAVAAFVVTVVALIGSVIRARWSRVVAIIAGVAVTLTCIGALVGIPIIVTAARAPDLTRKPA